MVKRKKRSNMCPCSVCRKDCLKTKALRCSMCDTWMHVNCIQRELCETQYQSWLERTDFLCPNCCFIPESDDFDCQHSLLRLRESLNNERTGDLLKVAEREELLIKAYLMKYPSITNIGQNFIDDNLSLRLLSECKDTFLDKTDLKPCKIEEDGNCFYRSVSLGLYGTQNEHVYLRLLTALEVLNNKEFYIRLVGPDSNELGDCRFVLPTFDNLVSSIVTLGGYADIVHFYALSAAIKSPIQSVYPQLLDDNSLTEVYSRKVVGRGVDGHNNAVLAVMWTMTDSTERKVGVFTPNHFVPLLDNNQLGTANGTLISSISRTNKDGSPQKVALVKRPTQERHKTDMDSQKDLTISFEEKPFRGNNKVMTFHENKKGQHLKINLPNDPLFRREELFSADGVKFELVPNSYSRTIPCLLHIRAKGRKFSMDFKCIYRNKQYDVELISCQNAFSCFTIQVNARVLATSSKKSIYSNGKFILASQQSLLIESRIKSPWICLQCTGNARLSPEANIETQHLELIGSTVFVDNCINYRHVENEKVSKQNPSKLTVLVTGDLHIGRDAFIGMGEHRKNILSELEIKITGDLCNHGQIKANDVLLLVCTNIRSCHECKTDTSQNYFKALTETNEVNQSSIDREIDTSKPSESAMMAARHGDYGYVHKLLSRGMDPNAPFGQNGRSLFDEARMSWMKIRRETNNIQGIISPKLNIVRQRADITDKLLDAWNRRSGIIASISLVCDISGNIDALGQLSCEQLNLKVKGNVIVEENSICTLGEISGKVCGAVQTHGTMKIRKFKEFEAGTFMLKQNSGLFVGDGGDLNVINLLKNEGYFYHENNGLIITTGEFETTVESRIESHSQLHVHIREDSNYLLGTIEANIVDFKFSAKCTNSGSLSATELCQFTFVHVENKCSQLENLSSIKVQKGYIEMKSNGYDNSSYDFINRGNVSTFGVYAESASIEVCQNSSFDVYPNSSEKRNFSRKGASIDVRAKHIKMEKSGKINMHVNDTVSSINLRCQGHLFQYGCIDIVPSSCAKHQLNIHVEQYIYEGSIENGQQLNLKIDQHMHSSEYMTAEAGITIEGEGALYNESGAYLHCPNGCINVIGSARIVNRKGARIKGKGVGMETMQCKNHTNEPEPLDFINEGVVESDDEITIYAGNIVNTGRLQSFNKSSGIELWWFGKHNSVMVSGKIFSSGWLRFFILRANKFKCSFKGGKSTRNDSMDSNDTIYMPDGDFAIECSEGDVFVESDVLQGDTKSKLTIVCAETCTIKSDININYLELFNHNKCKDDPSKMTLMLDGGRLEVLTIKACVQEKAFHVEAATTEDSFICRELLETDGCLQVKINLQLSSCCKVKALSVFIDENSRCLVSAEQSLNEDQCCLISEGDIHHNGRIETENKDSTVLLVSTNGDIYMKGTIIAANLILSSKEHTAFRSGCIVTAVNSLVAKMKKLTMEKDSYCHVGTRSGNGSLIIDCDEEINLEGSLHCFCKGVCSVECRDKILTKKSFRGEFAVATSQFVASKLLQLEECSLELHEGTFVFTNAHENDVEVHGDIRIIGSKLFGSRRTNNESDQNSLEIEGNNVYLEHSSMSCINSITIYAATNVILDENCSATNNGSIEMQATRIDFKGDLRDFETLSFKSSEKIKIFPSAKIQEGREIQLLTSTAEIFGSISTSDTFKIDVESALFHAEIKQCRNIHIEVDFVIINSGELHAKEIFVKSPIFINCPRNLSQNGEDQSAALIIGGIGTNQIKIEGILLVKIGCCVTGTSIKFESVMQFAFESNSSTIPDKDVLSRWKQTSESSLSKLRNGQGGTELQKLFQVATELPKVVCNLSASSNMSNDIVQLTKHIYEKGINTFDINQVTNVFERAHTLHSNIRSLRDEVKQIVRQKWKVIIKKKDKIKQAAMEILEKAKDFFKDEQDLVEGIQTRTFIHQSESCEQKSHAAILYTFGQNGLCVINGKLSARDDILISGSGLAIKARGLKAIKGMISLQGRDVAATQLDASVIEVTGEDTCLLDINVKEDLTVKSKSGNISNVRSGGKVSIKCSDSIHIEQIYAREGNFKARKALSVFINENSRCLVSAEQSLNEDQCCLISEGDIHHNGRIETENKDSTVLSVSTNGDIYMKGTIIAANLILSSKEHTAFRSGCIVTAVNSLVAKMKKLTMEKDSYCHVGTRSGNGSLIIDCDEEINLEGSLHCFCKGVCSVECRDKILTKKSFRGEFAVATSQFVASKLLQLEECSLELHEGTFVFTNAHENDVEVHGDIRIIGSKLFGSRRTNNESDQNSLEIEGNNVYLEHSSMSCINSITIYAATNVILDENCSATNNGSIEMQATRIDFKGDLRDFETLSFKSSEKIKIFPSAKIQEGREIQLLTSTAEIFGSISTSDTFKIDVESALFHAKIKQCRNIHIEVDFVIINSGELHAKEIFVKSPIFINCPRNLSQNGEDQSAALIIGGIGTNQIKIEGILLVKIGCCVTGTSIKFESVMQFAFESNSSTIPDKEVLSRWKQTSESALSKLRNGQGGTELQKLFHVATELPKVVCNLSASSNMCNDIVQLTKHIYEKGINTFDINQVTNVFERAHTLHSNIRSLRDEVKQIVRQKWKVIIKKKDKIKQAAMELLEKAKDFFKDEQDLVEGIQTRTFIHQSESCEQKSHAAILYTFGQNGLCVINGKLSARDDILISGSGLAIKARGLKAIKGMISLQGRDVAATQLDASVIEVTGEDTCLLDINVKEDLTVKSKSGNISNVRSGGKVSIKCSDSIHIEQIYAREGNFKARKALSVFIDENSRCLVSAEQSLNEDQCCLISEGDIHHNGRIETENKDSTVLSVSTNGDIYMKGTIIAAKLILSSKEHTSFRSGCIVTAVNSLVAKMKKLTMEKDSYCHVGTRSGNGSLIIDCDEEINLEGSLHCFCKGVCLVECRDKILTKKSFRGEFAVATSQFVASKLLQLEECSLELHEGTFVFTNAHENDVEVHGDIRIIGSKLFGSRRTNNESDQNSLKIEGNNVYLEHSSMSCINSITIYAATNVILDENCSATNNGSIEMQATRIDFKGDLRDFETLSFKSNEKIKIFPSAKIQEGREIQLLTSTAEIFGSISTSDTFKIDVESALFHAEIKQCRNIHIEVDFVIINSGELHAKEIFVKSPIFINCPRNLSQNGEDQSAALIIGGIGTNQIKIEGILLVKIGCCVTGTSIKFESVMQFAFESNSSTIPDKDVLSRWKQTSESSLSKLRNGQGGTELQKLFQVATELPKVVCNLSASSNMSNDIVQLTKHIYEKGINTFDINQVTNVFERAHTLYFNIRSLRDEVKQIVRQKWKVIIKKKDKIKQAAMELLEKAKDFFKDEQDLVEGIQTRTFIHQSESCEQKSHAAILYTFGHNGLCVINGKLSARDDILISGSGLAIKARGLKAIKGMISLQGRDVAATQLDASVIEVTGEDTCLLDINVKEDLTVKSKSGNISNVRSGGKVSIECSDSIHIEQIYAREGNFKARNVCLLDKEGKAKHEFQKLAIESKQLSDIDGLLDTTGAYKDMHVADELGLIVEDQDVIIANRKKCDFNVHVKAASLKIENDVSAKRFVAETTKGELSVSKNVNLQGDSIELKANTDLILNDKAKLEATVDGISLAAGRDICSSASISSKGSNTLVAKRDIKSRPTTYKTQSACKESSCFGFRSKTTVTETTHVEKPQICGETNVLKATRNVDIEATDISSKTNTSITAKGDVIIKDRVTETRTTTTNRFLGIEYRSETESLESSHGSQINTDGDVHVESENSNISWMGSSLKSKGNTTEIAEKGNITHKRRKLTNKESTQGLFFKSDNEKLDITYQNSSNTNQLTSDDIVDIGGSYTIKTKSYESSTNINVGSNMNVKTKSFNITGEKLYSDDSDFQLSLGLEKTRASAKIGFNRSRKTTYQATSLNVAKKLELNSESVTLSNVVAEVDEIEGNVDHMTMITSADEESEINFNTEVGIDVVTKTPDVSVGVGYNNSVKVNQPTELSIRGGSEKLRIGTLGLTGATVSFHRKVDNFAKNVVSRDVHEKQANFSLGLSVSTPKSVKQAKLKASLSADIETGRYVSCISSDTGEIDTSISNKVTTDKNKRRVSDFKFGIKLKCEGNISRELFESVGKDLCKQVGKTCSSELLKTIETKLGLPASIINDLAHIVEKGVRREDISSFIVKYIDKLLPADLRDPVLCLINGNPQKIVQWICVLIKADNNQIFTVMAEYILDKGRGKEEKIQKELILLIVKYGTKNLAGSENISKLLKCVADGNQLEDLSSLFTCPSIQAVALRLLKIFKVSDEVSDVIIGVFSGKNALEKGRPAIKLFASKLGFPYPDKLVTSIESMSKEGNPKKFLHWLIDVTGLDKIIDAKIVQGIVCSGTFGLAELSMIIKSICKKIGVAGDLLENLDMIIKGQFTNISIIILMARLVIFFVKKNKQTSVEGSDWPVTMKQIDRIESILSSFNADDTWMKISKIISILCVCLNIDSVTTQAIEDLILEGDATYFIKKLSLSSGISFELSKNLLANFDISWSIKDWIIYLVQIICAQFSVPPPLASDIVALTKGELPKNNLQSIASKIAIHATDQEVRESVRAMCSVLDVNVDIISDLIVILLRQNISDEIILVKCKVILTKSCGFSECFINALVDVAVTRDICALEFFIAEATGVYPEFVHLFTQSLAQKSVSEESYASAISCLITKLEIKNIDVSTVRKALSCNLSSSEIGKLLLKIVTQIFLKVPAFASGFQCLPNSLQTRLEMGHVTNCGEIIDDLLGFIAEEAGVSPDLLKGIKQFALDKETGLLSTWAHTKWHIDPHTTSRLLNSLQKSGLKTSALDVAKNLNFSAKSISHLECFLKGKDPKCHLSEVIWDFLKDIPNVLVSSDIIKQYCISLFEPLGLQPELKESITELVVYQKYDKLMSWAINKVGFDKNIVSELLQTISKFDDGNYVNLFITLLQKIGTFYGLSDDLMENIKLLFHHMAGIGNGQDPSEIVRTILPLFLKEILKQIPELERVGMILLDLIEKPKINCLLSVTLVCLEVVCKNEELLNVITSFVRWNDDSLVFKWLSDVFGLEERLCKGLLQLKGEDSVQIVAKRLLMLLATKWKLTDEITVFLISVVDRNCLHLVSGSNVEMQEDDIKQYLKNILHQNAVPEEEAEVLVKYLLELKSDEQLNIQYEHVRVVLRLLGLQSDIVDAFVLFLLEKNHGQLSKWLSEKYGLHQSVTDLVCKCVLTADSVHDSFSRFLESVYKSVGFDQLNICTIQTILENRMTFNEMADLTIKLVCQILTKRPEFADMMKNLPSSCQLILQSSNPFDVNIVFRCFVEFVAQKTGVTCHFYVSLASYIFEKKEDPLIEWISSCYDIDKELVSCFFKSVEGGKPFTECLKEVPVAFARHFKLSEKTIGHLQNLLDGKKTNCDALEFVCDTLKDIYTFIPEKEVLDTVIKVFESKKWLDRTILVLELLGKKMELPDIWIKAIKDLLTQRDPTGIISIISEKIKVDKDLLMVLAQAVLKKEQPTQIIRNLAKVGRIPDDAIRLIETLIRQITTGSVKGSRSCLSYKIDWSKALTVLNVTA